MSTETPYPFPQIASQDSFRENIILTTSPERTAELIEHHIRGEVYDENIKDWIQKRKPMMNDDGIDFVINNLKILMNQNATLTNMDKKDIALAVLGWADTLAKAFAMNTKEWALNPKQRSTLFYTIVFSVLGTYSRSLGKVISDKELYQGTIQSREIVQMMQQAPEKKGILKSLFSRKEPKFQRGIQ